MSKAVSKKLYPKSKIFEKKEFRVKNKKSVELSIEEHPIHFGASVILFKKGEAVSSADLKLMNDYQKKFYLEEK